MTFKTIIYSFILTTQFAFAQNDYATPEEETTQQKSQKIAYDQALFTYLRNHESLKIQLIGFSTYTRDEKKDINTIKKALNKAISVNSDKQILFLADHLCHSEEQLKSWCYNKNIHQIHQQVDGQNIMTYINSVPNKSDDEAVLKWMNLVSTQSAYSNAFMFELALELYNPILAFNLENDSLLKNDVIQQQELSIIKELQLIEKGLLKNYSDNNPKINALITSVGIMMAKPLLVSSLMNFCKNGNYLKQCNGFIKVLKTDNTLFAKLIADTINEQLSGLSEVNNNTKKHMNTISCYTQFQDERTIPLINADYFKQYMQDAIEYNEFTAIKNFSYKIYDTEVAHGFNPEFNPNDCESQLK